MKMRWAILFAGASAVTGISASAEVRFCHTSGAPYVVENEDGSLAGLWPAIIEAAKVDAIVEHTGRKRCADEVKHRDGAFEATFGRVFTPSRHKDFWMIPVYRQIPAVYYSTEQLPNGPARADGHAIPSAADLKDLQICGFAGWDYSYYTDIAGFPSLDNMLMISDTQGGSRFEKSLELVASGRCAAVEMPFGAVRSIKRPELFDGIGCYVPIGDRWDVVSMMVSRSKVGSDALALELFDKFTELTVNRSIGKILDEHLNPSIAATFPDHIAGCLSGSVAPLVD